MVKKTTKRRAASKPKVAAPAVDVAQIDTDLDAIAEFLSRFDARLIDSNLQPFHEKVCEIAKRRGV